MSEHAHSQETNVAPQKVNFGRDPFEPARAMTGFLYDRPGQTLIPSNSATGNGGLFSYDDDSEVEARIAHRGHATFEDLVDLGGATGPPQGRILVKTADDHVYWIEDGAVIDVEDTLRSGKAIARSVADSEKRMTVGAPWSYKSRGQDGTLSSYQIGSVAEIAVYDLGFRYGDDASVGDVQPYYDGFDKAKTRLASVGVEPHTVTQTLLFPNSPELRSI